MAGRLDIFVNELSAVAEATRRKETLKVLIPVGTIIFLAGLGYIIFGNQAGFIAMTALGVALAEIVRLVLLRV